MVCYCDEPAQVWNETERKARKEYTCEECGEKIEKGDQYTHISSLFDGRWSNMKVCEYCMHDWKVLTDAGHCMTIGELKDSWTDHWANWVPKKRAGHVSYSSPGGNLWK